MLKKTATLEWQGRTYTLILDLRAMAKLEEHLSTPTRNVTIEEAMTAVERGSLRHIMAFFWAALQRHHPDMTLDRVVDLIEDLGLEGLADSIQALKASTQADPADVKELGLDKRKGRNGHPRVA